MRVTCNTRLRLDCLHNAVAVRISCYNKHDFLLFRERNPEELLGTLKWLTDDDASGFVTGVVVPVDGGFNAYSGV